MYKIEILKNKKYSYTLTREEFEKKCDELSAFAWAVFEEPFPPGVKITSPSGEVVDAPWRLKKKPYDPDVYPVL